MKLKADPLGVVGCKAGPTWIGFMPGQYLELFVMLLEPFLGVFLYYQLAQYAAGGQWTGACVMKVCTWCE